MESEKSRIPLYNFQHSKAVGIIKDTPMFVHSKNQDLNKVVDLNPLKDADFKFAVNIPVSLISKDANQRPPKLAKNIVPQPPKKAMTATARSPTNRYRREAELRNKNKLLESVKCDLSIKLAGIQKELKEMKEHNDSLEKENEKLTRFQESCMLLLETRNYNSVTGEKILEDEEENKKTQTEIMDLSEKLNAELQLFVQMAKEQKENFQNTQMKWKQIEEEEAHFLEQQQHSHKEMEDLFAILNQDNGYSDSS